ncbi:hypothetical protein A9Q74_06290 [Colwellia sp. 39_35_sub15_T18]|nr:hypothetical protein A9Q74_06290 [Colwellia sp. 39_35_sub15_T18]
MAKTKLKYKVSLIAAVIISAMHTGYRRAGIAFDKGDNTVEIDELQLAQIEQDSNLLVQSTESIEPNTDHSTQGNLDADGLGMSVNSKDEIHLDNAIFDGAPPELIHFVITLHLLHQETPLAKAPKCDELECEFVDEDNNTKMVKPSAAQRDAAWVWYQDNIINHVPG